MYVIFQQVIRSLDTWFNIIENICCTYETLIYPYLCLKMEIVTKTCYYLSIQLSHHYSRYAVARKSKTISRQIKSSGLRNEKREFKLFHA